MSDHQAWTFPREPRPPCSMPRVKQRTPPIASSGFTTDLIGNFSTPQLGLRTTWCHFRCHSPQTDSTATTARSIRQWWTRRPRSGGKSIHYPGEGNRRFFVYAVALRTAGMSLPDIESKLVEEAQFGRSPKERREQIPSIIASLKKTCRKAA